MGEKKYEKWKMFIDWEELSGDSNLDLLLWGEIFRALRNHHYNNYLKIKKRLMEV